MLLCATYGDIEMKKFYSIPETISKFSLGKVVGKVPFGQCDPEDDLKTKSAYDILAHGTNHTAMMVGHVVGFAINTHNEYIVIVKWANGEEYPIHPNNLIVLG